jgi:hypothetical protein
VTEKPTPTKFHGFLIENKASIWICFMVLILAATMMHPTGASVITILMMAGLLLLLRFVAHIEGRRS